HTISKRDWSSDVCSSDLRGLYGGCILYFGFDGNMDSCITIRTMILENHTVSVQAGAGVVAASTPEGEYQETVNKASALFNAINQIGRASCREKGSRPM